MRCDWNSRGDQYCSVPLSALILLCQIVGGSPPASRSVAVTFDDLPTVSVLGEDFARAERTSRDLLSAIRRAGIPAIGFVNERKLQPDGGVEPRRIALLERWLAAGLELGNHTFSHVDLHETDLESFKQDVIRGDQVTRRLLAAHGRKPRFFRHPFLHTGRSREARSAVNSLLASRGYTVAPITIDNDDYVFAAAYDRALEAGDRELAKRLLDAYLTYMDAIFGYYERQSVALVGREIAQTLLLHANALNGAALERLVDRLRGRGYRFVTLKDALADAAYASADGYFGPAGITWLHRWALTQGKRGSFFAGEPEVPGWVRAARQGSR
jgi:peptidoglycan/xylan/chitin deacetylase (PgdA/CDA1 family)